MKFLTTLLCASAIGGSAMAAQAWVDYRNEELGYEVQFPEKPTEWKGVYTAEIIRNIPTRVEMVKTKAGPYTVMIADFSSRKEDGAILIGEVEYWLGNIGEISVNNTARLTQGRNYGRFLTINCSDDFIPEGEGLDIYAKKMWKDAANVECPNGARMVTNIYLVKGKLMVVIGVNYPDETGDVDGPAALRFAQSVAWYGPNAPKVEDVVGAVIPQRPAAP